MHVVHKYRGMYQTNQLKELKVIALGSGQWWRQGGCFTSSLRELHDCLNVEL